MNLRLRDTLSGELRALPADRPLKLYVCGVTPYDVGHLGHAFTFVQFDALVRALEWLGYEVTYVQNVTDIDDSILSRARELALDWRALGDTELARHRADMSALNVRPPTHMPRATAVIPQIVELIGELIARNCAYVAGGSVFFRVRSAVGFGRLSRLDRDAMLEIAARQDDADVDDPRKEDALDVALWKPWSTDPDEPRWDSPWGPGRPGWTIECAALNRHYLGDQIDLHGGGVDLVFPHHETEIGLMEAATGRRPFVRTWMHTAMVRHAGEKMSKSLGNLVGVRGLVDEFGAEAVRLYLLSHHYRAEWEFSAERLRAAADTVDRLRARATDAETGADATGDRATDDEATREFRAALEEDFDTPRALAALEHGSGATVSRLAGVLGLRLS